MHSDQPLPQCLLARLPGDESSTLYIIHAGPREDTEGSRQQHRGAGQRDRETTGAY